VKATPTLGKAVEENAAEKPSRFEILKQLEKIATSEHFRNSKRYPALLRFIVEHTLSGRTDVLKERTLGTEVFGKPSDYDTNADPIVRVTAGEIRKRLAQYYRTAGHEHELCIDLPLGSYVPQFHTSPPVPSAADLPPKEAEGESHSQDLRKGLAAVPAEGTISEDSTRSRFLRTVSKPSPKVFAAILILSLILIVTGFLEWRYLERSRTREQGIAYLWDPILSSGSPALIVIGVHWLDANGRDMSPATYATSPPKQQQSMLSSEIYFDMVPVSDVVSYSQLTRLLTQHSHFYRTQGAAETTFGDLQRGPVILVGGLDNVWTLRLTSALRYRFGPRSAGVNAIVDSARPLTAWKFDNSQSAVSNSRDYAIVASYFDPEIAQHVIIAAGIGKSGTATATEFLTNNHYLKSWLSQIGPSKSRNVEVVLSTEIVEGEPGPPQVVASYRW
jgi:hypothetical protein